MRLVILAVAALLASGATARAPQAVFVDPVADAAHPANVVAFVLLSHGAAMNALLYTASGAGKHPTLLLFHGFPGNEQNLDIAQAARRAGWHVLTLHYRGSWGSKGDFSFAHTIEDGQVALDWLRDPANVVKHGIDPARIVVGGHSMGGFVAAKTASANPGVRGLMLIDAWNIGTTAARVTTPAARAQTLTGFAENTPPLAGTSPEALLDEAVAHAKDWNLVADAPALARQPLLDIGAARGRGGENAAIAAAVNAQPRSRVTAVTMPTDHSFSDHRIALATAVVGWLETLK